MKISTANPPYDILQKCQKHFDLTGSIPAFTFGDTIYNPLNGNLDPFLEAHEFVHSQQQGNDPRAWWDNYFLSDKFRFLQEIQAYRVQYKMLKGVVKDRNALNQLRIAIAQDLSGKQYGNMCTYSEAMDLIK